MRGGGNEGTFLKQLVEQILRAEVAAAAIYAQRGDVRRSFSGAWRCGSEADGAGASGSSSSKRSQSKQAHEINTAPSEVK